MGLTLAQALRLQPYEREGYRALAGTQDASAGKWSAAFVGAGGKTTAIFQLARELTAPVIVTTTTHIGDWQIRLADTRMIVRGISDFAGFQPRGVALVSGPLNADARAESPSADVLLWLHDYSQAHGVPLLIEADGSRQRPLKAPGPHEPVIPDYVDMVVSVAGLSGLAKPLSEEFVHRPEAFAALSGLQAGSSVSAEGVIRALTSDRGGLKHIPPGARRVVLLNQANTAAEQAQAHGMVQPLLSAFDSVVIANLHEAEVHAAHERVAGIVLAAGGSQRFGQTKQLLDWHGQPFVCAVARTALAARLWPVVVVTGSSAPEVERSLVDLPVQTVKNEQWQSGQASSLQSGLRSLPGNTGAAIFLLADQPQISHDVIEALVETHATGLQPIVAPLVMMEQRANPVLFDRVTFQDLLRLQGDVGGRAIFSEYPVKYMPWHDDRLLLDVDTEQDYRRLTEDDTL